MAKAKGAKKKAAAKPKTKAKAKAKKPAPARKVVVAKPTADNGLAKRMAALEAAIASMKKGSAGSANSTAISKAIDEAATDIRQRAEDADVVAMAEMRKYIDKALADLATADERLQSDIGAADAKGDLAMDEINALRRRLDVFEERLAAKK
ncbi:MAG: hypothetical protein AB7O88_26475 [Reyranellaceae bacterium]